MANYRWVVTIDDRIKFVTWCHTQAEQVAYMLQQLYRWNRSPKYVPFVSVRREHNTSGIEATLLEALGIED